MTKAQRAKTMAALGLTEEVMTEVRSAANGVWQYIGGDVLDAVAMERGKCVNAVTIPRSHVIELVMDADRIEDKLKTSRVLAKHPEAKVLFDYKNVTARDLLRAEVKAAFTFARYGM